MTDFEIYQYSSSFYLYNSGYYIESPDTPLTVELLQGWLERHKQDCIRYRFLKAMYEGQHPILSAPKKEDYKPDNRIVCNFAKYIVDTLNGYFIGKPVKTVCEDKAISAAIEQIERYNDQDDNNAELSKICSIYGCGYEFLYRDEIPRHCITYLTPLESFVVYDDTVARKPLYGVRYYYDKNNIMHGSIFTESVEMPFSNENGLHFVEEKQHHFNGVPLIEYIENEERTGAFEHVTSQIIAYDKAISEKANDVDYFADAYLKILGAKLDGRTLDELRRNRIINMESTTTDQLIVEFLEKPNADTTQENLLERLETEIFNLSMVANISDKEFGNATGNALSYKLLSMDNLCRMKERKFVSGMNQRWRLIASDAISGMPADAWMQLQYQFTRNAPRNLLEEVQTASAMQGITSQKTQLKIISAVDNVEQEIAEIDKETGTEPADTLRADRMTDDAAE